MDLKQEYAYMYTHTLFIHKTFDPNRRESHAYDHYLGITDTQGPGVNKNGSAQSQGELDFEGRNNATEGRAPERAVFLLGLPHSCQHSARCTA